MNGYVLVILEIICNCWPILTGPRSPANSARSSATLRSTSELKRRRDCHRMVLHSWMRRRSIPRSSVERVLWRSWYSWSLLVVDDGLTLLGSVAPNSRVLGANGGLCLINSNRSMSRIACEERVWQIRWHPLSWLHSDTFLTDLTEGRINFFSAFPKLSHYHIPVNTKSEANESWLEYITRIKDDVWEHILPWNKRKTRLQTHASRPWAKIQLES